MSWDLRSPDPIPVSGRKPLETLCDAGAYITALPAETHSTPSWQTAIDCLPLAADKGGPVEFARLAMEKALRPKPTPSYTSAKKDVKWRSNYKLVRDR
ncbi:hypothetical protein [Tardiphaga sp.]|uniref:hypothetical protein n=1 Tax=Tardiphaga sp. TaxID=1926292 RepID=UPI00262AB9FF|nr:hypothetical protein [Tardiphaga sp.]MDB5616602.1 hypothetical protein [Tardiphaga sp.]